MRTALSTVGTLLAPRARATDAPKMVTAGTETAWVGRPAGPNWTIEGGKPRFIGKVKATPEDIRMAKEFNQRRGIKDRRAAGHMALDVMLDALYAQDENPRPSGCPRHPVDMPGCPECAKNKAK
jgi:hypothetical protein